MPPFAAELEEWWLSCGYEPLTRLVDSADSDPKPKECGFAQAIQRKLRNFDNDRVIRADIQATWPAIRAARGIDYEANPRKRLKEASRSIFKRPEDGGLNQLQAMDGLGYLDAMEVHRLRLVEATKIAMDAGAPEASQVQVIKELHSTATAHYGHFHMGFRICSLLDELTAIPKERKEIPKLMARLNALFPASVFLEDDEDFDPSPYSPGLRDSIRFSVFEHLMGETPFAEQQQQMIRVKLLCWCDIPGYPDARQALLRYSEESKKLEEVCFAVLNALERRPLSNISMRASSAESSFMSFAGASMSPEPFSNAPRKSTPEVGMSADASFDSRYSDAFSPASLHAPPVPNPLLKGMPGREISAAKTDTAALARDLSAPPILTYPEDLSKTEFYQHPLAQELDMTSLEKYTLDSEDEEEEESKPHGRPKSPNKRRHRRKGKDDVPPVPPLPPIPENLRYNLTPKLLGRIVKRMRSRSQMMDLKEEDETNGTHKPFSGFSETPKLTIGKQRPSLKSQISNPELIFSGTAWNVDQKHRPESVVPLADTSRYRRQLSLPTTFTSRIDDATLPTKENSKLKHRLAKPRLSPMEYTRLYLVEKALSDREERPCELPRPEKMWYWTPHWEKFLIIPKIPDGIQRDFALAGATDSEPVDVVPELQQDDSDNESVATVKADTQQSDYPRLSLNLGGMTVLLPSIMDGLLSGDSTQALHLETSRLQGTTPASAINETRNTDMAANGGVSDSQRNEVSPCEDGETPDVSRQILGHLRSTLAPTLGNDRYGDADDELRGRESKRISRRSLAHLNDPTSYYEITPYARTRARVDCKERQHEFQGTSKRARIEPDAATDTSSQYSQDSVETALFLGNREVGNLVIPMTLDVPKPATRSTTRAFNPSYTVNETPIRRMIEYNPRSASSPVETLTPLAHFPIAAQPTSRLTPSTLARQVIGGAGGHLHSEDARQAHLVRSVSTNLREAFSADVWTLEPEESMLPGLQPEPLRLSRRKSQVTRDQGRRFSHMVHGLSKEISVEMRDFEGEEGGDVFREMTYQEMSDGCEGDASFIEDGWYSQAETIDEAVARLKHQVRETAPSRGTRGLPRSASATITPTNSWDSLTEHSPSILRATNEPSGFTPRDRKGVNKQWSIPHSSIMAGFKDSEAFEKEDSQTVNDSKEQKRFGLIPPKRRLSRTPARQHREEALTNSERALPLAPPGMRSFALWTQGHGYHVNKDESVSSDEVLGELDLGREISTTTRNFSQPSEPKKSRPKHIPIPVDAYRFASQRFGPSGRIVSTTVAIDGKNKTPSPPNGKDPVVVRTPTSAISNMFRKRHRSEQPTTPLTPTTPVHWKPFDEPEERVPCSSPWPSGHREDKLEKMERAAYFREKAKRESMIGKGEASAKNALLNVGDRDDMRQGKSWERRQSMDGLVGWRSFISDSPEQPPPSSPLPPVPPLPDSSKLMSLAATTRDFSAPPTGNTRYKAKKPQGLKVETNKLRKPSKEGLRLARKTSSSGGSRTAFKMDGRPSSFGRVAEDDERVDEVVKRRRE
ncbi:Fc.00g028720.m01.CDS01 [Cosmosporella sp. VM-42]